MQRVAESELSTKRDAADNSHAIRAIKHTNPCIGAHAIARHVRLCLRIFVCSAAGQAAAAIAKAVAVPAATAKSARAKSCVVIHACAPARWLCRKLAVGRMIVVLLQMGTVSGHKCRTALHVVCRRAPRSWRRSRRQWTL